MSISPDAFGGENLAFVEGLYETYLQDPSAVDPEWQAVFGPLLGEQRGMAVRPSRAPRSIFNPAAANGGAALGASDELALQDKLDQLTAAFRSYGHLEAMLDPLDRGRPTVPALDPRSYGICEADLEREVSSTSLGSGLMTVGQVLRRLRATYCRYIGVQFTHIDNPAARTWLQEQMESTENRCPLSHDDQVELLSKLIDAELFEQFIRRKFLGAKSFSLEGGESLIPLLHLAVEHASAQGVETVVIGMAHRGRLSVLTNILRKHPQEIFREFDDKRADSDPALYWGRGDVKYHLGFRTHYQTKAGRTMHLRLAFNPSHLEFVGPVVFGRVRARQDRSGDRSRRKVMPIVIHGDAAMAGQGIVQEMLNLGELEGYRTGGTLHVIVNNQIGFTTNPEHSRSCRYSTDVATMLQAPIFHVNGEHPESVVQAVQLAMLYRQRYRTDVFIDMYCYRRHGHNEGDEPSFTQPKMYEAIRGRPTVREGYLHSMLGSPGGLTKEQADAIVEERTQYLEEEFSKAREDPDGGLGEPEKRAWPWAGLVGGPDSEVPEVETAVPRERLASLLRKSIEVPEDFTLFKKLQRILSGRDEMAAGERPLDWGAGEALAFATLLADGHPVRISGQDSRRGTFSHRHAVLVDSQTEETYAPLAHLSDDQGSFEVWNSPLSEAGVLAFDYGYSLDRPDALVVWEAQFGDFANGAQVIIDQFITSAEDKWDLLSGMVMLMPHGFEGQGPEHSSARLERFLQMCAEDNIQVVYLTTPAQIYHCLRRQALRSWRKPLVVMSPKSLLRHPDAVSPLEDLAEGRFQKVLRDRGTEDLEGIRRILLCSGRVAYDLESYRAERKNKDVAILRVEQLYPFPDADLQAALEELLPTAQQDCEAVWVQEEPLNMGAWYFLRARLGESLFGQLPLRCVARDESASPATGSPASHKREQQVLVARAFWS